MAELDKEVFNLMRAFGVVTSKKLLEWEKEQKKKDKLEVKNGNIY